MIPEFPGRRDPKNSRETFIQKKRRLEEMACAGQLIRETAMTGVQRWKENLMADVQHLGRNISTCCGGRFLRHALFFVLFLCFFSVIFFEIMNMLSSIVDDER